MFRLAIAALAFCLTAQPSLAEDVFTFRIQSLHNSWVKVKFYSTTRKVVWPGKDISWDLRDDASHDLRLSCTPGEQICFGAWEHAAGTPEWGSGRKGQQGCSDCCWRCENGKQSQIIVLTYERSPATKRMLPIHRLVATSSRPPKQSPILPSVRID